MEQSEESARVRASAIVLGSGVLLCSMMPGGIHIRVCVRVLYMRPCRACACVLVRRPALPQDSNA